MIIVTILLFSSCTTKLTPEGIKVIKLKKDMVKNCQYIDMIRASENDANGVINQIKNKVAKLGGDAYFPTKGRVGLFGATAIVDAYKCNVNKTKSQPIINEPKLKSKNNNIIISKGNISIVKNQKYACSNIGSRVNGKFIPQKDENFANQYPRRFYIDNKNMLHTDNGDSHTFLKRIDEFTIGYYNPAKLIVLTVGKDGIMFYNVLKTKEKISVVLVYSCFKTDNWTLGK
jgi:hypothetical protein